MQETATRMAPSSEVEGRLYITQSPYYSPAFNGAVFDGPLRLYFSQSQEALALKFYFELRAKTQSMTEQWPRSGGVNLFVMIYPTEETFDLCFLSQGLQWTPETLPLGRLGRDYVVAVQAHELEGDMMSITKKLTALIGAITPLAEGPR